MNPLRRANLVNSFNITKVNVTEKAMKETKETPITNYFPIYRLFSIFYLLVSSKL